MIARFVRLGDMLYAEITGVVEFLWAPNGVERSDRDDCGHDQDPDGPEMALYDVTFNGLRSLMLDAAHRVHNGDDPEESVTAVLRAVELADVGEDE